MLEFIQLARGVALEEFADPRVGVAEEAIRRVETGEVRRRLAALPQPEQNAVAWSYGLDGKGRELSAREIGQLLGVSKAHGLAHPPARTGATACCLWLGRRTRP